MTTAPVSPPPHGGRGLGEGGDRFFHPHPNPPPSRGGKYSRPWSYFRLVLLLALLALAFGGCKAAEDEKHYGGPDTGPAYGDMFIDASIGDASTLLPPLASDAASFAIIGLVYDSLLKYDGDLNLVSNLAESWQVSADGLTLTFKLRQGVKWHDGAPCTAQDVLFSYQVMVDPKTPTAYSGDYLQVKKAEAPDDYTFRVTYPKPFAPALGSWTSLSILPRHLLAGQDLTKSPLARHPIGTGPYKFKEWRAGEKIALTYNPDYFEGRPYLNGYLYLVKPDTGHHVPGVEGGESRPHGPQCHPVYPADGLSQVQPDV